MQGWRVPLRERPGEALQHRDPGSQDDRLIPKVARKFAFRQWTTRAIEPGERNGRQEGNLAKKSAGGDRALQPAGGSFGELHDTAEESLVPLKAGLFCLAEHLIECVDGGEVFGLAEDLDGFRNLDPVLRPFELTDIDHADLEIGERSDTERPIGDGSQGLDPFASL